MSVFNIEVSGGKTVRLPVAGKYCDRDIVVTALVDEGTYNDGYVNGVQAEHVRFWSEYQDNGNRTDYSSAFRGKGWTDQTFEPKYDFIPSTCSEMFRNSGIVDLVGILKRTGVTFNTSNATTAAHMMANTAIEESPHFDLSNAYDVSYLYNNCRYLVKASLTFAEGTIVTHKYIFSGCYALKDLTISGVIDFELSLVNSAELTPESVQSVIDALKDLTGQATKKVTFARVVGANLTEEQRATITAKNWTLVY